ncbi:UNVERIFIED_CONTAM: heme O synthase-like polyprenyltransferase [Streptomyces canus]
MTAVESRPAGVLGASQSPVHRPFGARVKAFVALTKPRIIELLLITTVPVMFLAQQGVPDLKLVLLTCVGGYLSAGGANALNMYIDRDIDALMDRTSQRPLVTGMVSPRECLAFGTTLAVVSTLLFGLAVNWLSAWLSLGALLFYVVVYTMILKRRTSQKHRVGRHRRLPPGPDRLVGRHELHVVGADHPLPGHVLLDAAALLAAVHEGA